MSPVISNLLVLKAKPASTGWDTAEVTGALEDWGAVFYKITYKSTISAHFQTVTANGKKSVHLQTQV
jgi:hypothetical protein